MMRFINPRHSGWFLKGETGRSSAPRIEIWKIKE